MHRVNACFERAGTGGGRVLFACNMDPSGTKEFVFTPIIGRCLNRHKKDYAELSETPEQFDAFAEAVGQMQRTQHQFFGG